MEDKIFGAMDDGETQDSSTISSATAENVSSSLPKMHSLVQCGTEKYWEVEPSCVNWIRFIKASPGPIFESQTSSDNGRGSDVPTVFATIASTEPRVEASGGSPSMEMIIQLEVCFLTGIGHLLAVRAMENSHGALYAMKNGLQVRYGTLFGHQKLHLMRPGDKICYVQDGDELIMEYKCETVIETSDSQNLARESFSALDQTQDTFIPATQQLAQKSQGGLYFTQESESQLPSSQASIRESNDIPKADLHSQQPNENPEALDDAILDQASSGDTTVDPTDVREETLPSHGIQSLNRPKSSPVRDETEEGPGLLAAESSEETDDDTLNRASSGDTTEDPTEVREGKLPSQGIQSLKHTPKSSPVHDKTEEGPGLLVPGSSTETDEEALSQASLGDTTVDPTEVREEKLPTHGIKSLNHSPKSSPVRDETEEGPGLLAPESLHTIAISNELSKEPESVKHTPKLLRKREIPDRDGIVESSSLFPPKSLHTTDTHVINEVKERAGLLAPEILSRGETPTSNEVEESPGLFAPTQALDLLVTTTKDQPSHPTLPDDSPVANLSTPTPRRKRGLGQMVGSGRMEEKETSLNECDSTPARMTRSKTVGTQPRVGKKVQKPRILVTGFEIDSIIEAVSFTISTYT